jgi:hypothetical protein
VSALHPTPTTPGTFLCPRCGGALRHDQAWCLECGLAARTRIHPPPSWRVPVAVTCVALALLAAGIAFTLYTLLDTPQPPPAATTVTVPATAPTTVPPTTTAPAVTTPPATVPQTTRSAPATPGAAVPEKTPPSATTRTPAPSRNSGGKTLPAPGTSTTPSLGVVK